MPLKTEASVATAREFNANIRELAERFGDDSDGDADIEYVFLCECGCGRGVGLTLAALVLGGAWLADHVQSH